MTLRNTLLLLTTAVAAHGQAFTNLATTEDGSTLYFASTVRQRGTNQSSHSKIFRWDATNGFRIAAEQPDKGDPIACTTTNFYDLTNPSVSSDGAVLAYTGTRSTGGGRICPPVEPSQTLIGAAKLTGMGAISRNGRYAITAPAAAQTSHYHFVTDLASNTTTAVAGAFRGTQDIITDQGAILTTEPMALVLWERNGLTRVFPTRYAVSNAVVDRAGRTAIYTSPFTITSPSGGINRIDLTTGRETELHTAFAFSSLSVSSDASTVLFIESGKLYILTGSARELATDTKGFISAILSGDGRIAYAVTADSRLLRIDVASGAITEVAPPTPVITQLYRLYQLANGILALGNNVDVSGSGLDATHSVRLCNREIATTDFGGAARFQVPFDLPPGPCRLEVSSSVFEHSTDVTIVEHAPQFNPLFFHGGFRGSLSPADPARPGEVIVAYMAGLGPVDEARRPKRVGFECTLDGQPALVEHVALTAEFPGIYQVNIRVPVLRTPTPSASITCGWDIDARASMLIPVVLSVQ